MDIQTKILGKGKFMGKTVRSNDPQSKKFIKDKKRCRVNKDHNHEESHRPRKKGHHPCRIWPTDSENHKGPLF